MPAALCDGLFFLIAGTVGCRFCLGHSLRHLRFDCVEIEARAVLHWREFQESLDFLAHYLLYEYEAPELELEPVEILLPTILRPVVRQTRALERIQAQIGNVRYVRMSLLSRASRQAGR